MNYRTFYKKILNTNIPIGWDIHHIDYNKRNNSIFNLVAIPKKLHTQHHTNKTFVDRYWDDIYSSNYYTKKQKQFFNYYLDNFINTKNEIGIYINERNNLLHKNN